MKSFPYLSGFAAPINARNGMDHFNEIFTKKRSSLIDKQNSHLSQTTHVDLPKCNPTLPSEPNFFYNKHKSTKVEKILDEILKTFSLVQN